MEKNQHHYVKELTEIFVFCWYWIHVIQSGGEEAAPTRQQTPL